MVRPWQRAALRHIFARGVDGRRRHRVALYATGRKNGKTSLTAGVALYGLTMEGEGAQVIGCAADREQAKLMFSAAKRMVELDPDLSDEIRIFSNVLEHKTTGSVYRAVSSEAYTKEGLSPTLVVGDEPHAWPTRELFDVMSLAMGARRDPLFLLPTTAGVMSTRTEDTSLLYGLFLYMQSIIRGEVDDPSFCGVWWSAETEEADHRDERVWREANPGLGDLLDIEDLRSKVRITPESEFRTKRLNLFVPTDDFWLPAGVWDACRLGAPDPKDWLHGLDRRAPVTVGIDIAIVHDASAVVVAQRKGEKVVVRARCWLNPNPEGTKAHQDWRMPLDEIVAVLRELRRTFPASAARIDGVAIPGPAYVYDRYGLASTELTLESEHFALIPIAQQGGWMVEASRRFYEAVLDVRVEHDGDPTLAAHLRNVVPRQVGESGWRLEKPSRARKIDAAVASVMAVSQALEKPPTTWTAFAA